MATQTSKTATKTTEPTNYEGLTWAEWLAASTLNGDEFAFDNEGNPVDPRAEWADGVDPSDWRAWKASGGVEAARKVIEAREAREAVAGAGAFTDCDDHL